MEIKKKQDKGGTKDTREAKRGKKTTEATKGEEETEEARGKQWNSVKYLKG